MTLDKELNISIYRTRFCVVIYSIYIHLTLSDFVPLCTVVALQFVA